MLASHSADPLGPALERDDPTREALPRWGLAQPPVLWLILPSCEGPGFLLTACKTAQRRRPQADRVTLTNACRCDDAFREDFANYVGLTCVVKLLAGSVESFTHHGDRVRLEYALLCEWDNRHAFYPPIHNPRGTHWKASKVLRQVVGSLICIALRSNTANEWSV